MKYSGQLDPVKMKDMFDLVVVGNFCIDLIKSPRITSKLTLGGSPTYVSVAARNLRMKVSIISNVGEDFSDEYIEWLIAKGVDLSGLKQIKNALTTSFVLRYDGGRRRLKLESLAPSIEPEDIPKSLEAKVIHIAPIANEITPKVVNALRKAAKTLSIDPQGFIRSFDKNGNVSLNRLTNLSMLKETELFKSSSDEVKIGTGLSDLHSAMKKICECGVKIVIATKGAEGSFLFYEGAFHFIPSCKPRFNVDSTGAGDTFMGSFLAEYIRGRDPIWCACAGSAAASFVVEGLGPAVFGTQDEVYARATEIYEQIK
jgi:sugar/nucleoside kinase (ribokinase family)